MKLSKFIRDLLTTSSAQVAALVLNLVLLKIMAVAVSTEGFGIFMVMRRIIGVGAPLITLNLGVGIARYVSYEREKKDAFLFVSMAATTLLSFLTIIGFVFFRRGLASLLLEHAGNARFIVLTGLFLYGYGLFSVSYSYFRGKLDMSRANRLQVIYYGFPVVLAALLWRIYPEKTDVILTVYFICYSVWGFFIGAVSVMKELRFSYLARLREVLGKTRDLFSYSIYRIPSGFFLTLLFGIPVFFASRKLSLEAAGFAGIAISVIRLTEITVTPFNLLFLPKFAELKRNADPGSVREKSGIVIDFIITVLPFLAVLLYGLAEHIVLIFFGAKYLDAVQGVSIIIGPAVFYLVYVLVRGILDGLYSFPYVNIICIAGLFLSGVLSVILGQTVNRLVFNFGVGLMAMGISSLFIMVKRGGIQFPLRKLFLSLVSAAVLFFLLFFLDRFVNGIFSGEYVRFAFLLSYRLVFLCIIVQVLRKTKTAWVRALSSRITRTEKKGGE